MNHSEYMRIWRKNHPGYYKQYKKDYYKKHKKEIDIVNKEWAKNNRKKCNEILSRYKKSEKGKIQSAKERVKYKKQIKARRLVNNLLRYHNIKGACAICGRNKNIEAHHENYGEPFVTIWLCKNCHVEIHYKERNSKAELRISME